MKNGKWLTLALWILAAGCSGGGEAAPKAGSAGSAEGDQARAAQPAPARSESFSRGTVPMTVVARVARHDYRSSGTGECASSAEASIYDVPATLWHATYQDETAHLNLTVWRPRAGGSDMVGLSFTSGEILHRIATVKGGELVGSGTAGVRPGGSGGTLTVTGKDDHGHAIELSVECARFDEVVAEGG
ncbi:MAG TPA: hypothetical protein VG500_08485 [Gemmatimonadales bacterium]|jgi:hypothetical protein|nr:hypothetical protein [Gemmatimonadales bacterium]